MVYLEVELTRILIPRERNNAEMVDWLETHVGKKNSKKQPYVRQFGDGWDLSTHSEPWGPIMWKITFEDDKKAMMFALRWL